MKDRIRNRGGKKKWERVFAAFVRAHLRLERYNVLQVGGMVAALWFERGGVTGTAEGVVGDYEWKVGLPLDTTAARPKSKLYHESLRFALSLSLFRPSPTPVATLSLAMPPCRPALSFLLSLASWYVRTIANGLQPLPGIYPRNLPERPSNSTASSRAFALILPIPQDPSRESTDCALFKQRDTFPSTTSQFSPGRSPICLAFPSWRPTRVRDRPALDLPVLLSPSDVSSPLFAISAPWPFCLHPPLARSISVSPIKEQLY